MQSLRVIAGFLVAPLIPGLVIAALPGPGAPPNWPLLARLTGGAVIVAPYAYVVTLVFGIPAFLIYRRFQLVRFAHYTVGGCFGSMAAFWIIGMFVSEATPWQLLWPGVRFGLLTLPAVAVFWVIAVFGNDDEAVSTGAEERRTV